MGNSDFSSLLSLFCANIPKKKLVSVEGIACENTTSLNLWGVTSSKGWTCTSSNLSLWFLAVLLFEHHIAADRVWSFQPQQGLMSSYGHSRSDKFQRTFLFLFTTWLSSCVGVHLLFKCISCFKSVQTQIIHDWFLSQRVVE